MYERLLAAFFSAGCRSLFPGLWKAKGVVETNARLAATIDGVILDDSHARALAGSDIGFY